MTKKRFVLPKIPKITEARVVSAVFTIGPWFTPIITAWIVYNKTQELLYWGWLQALVSATIIEINGIASTSLVLYLYREHAERRLIALSGVIVGLYAISVLLLTVALDTWPNAAKMAPLIFVILVLSSNATVGIRAHQKQVKANVKTLRKTIDKNSQDLDTRSAILAHFIAHPESTLAHAGKECKVSRQRVGQILDALEKSGEITRNGKVIVLERKNAMG